jgi:ADP-heptose:LPS heptosyltransferase
MKRMLYFGPSGIGDWCVIYPSVSGLLKKYDCDKVSIVVPYQNPGNELLRHNPLIDEVIYLHRATSFGEVFLYSVRWLQLLLQIRRGSFQALAVSYLSNQIDFLLLAILSGISERIGRITKGSFFQKMAFTSCVEASPNDGKLETHLRYTGGENIEAENVVPLFDDSLLQGKEDVIKKHQIERPYIVLAVGGGRNAQWRFWPAKYYKDLAALLRDYQCVLVGGGSDDAHQAQSIVKNGPNNIVNLVGRTTMSEALCLINASRAVVGNDSGITNISAILCKPTLTIYGPSNPGLTGAALLGSAYVNVEVECGPCFVDDQDTTIAINCSHYNCLNWLKPEIVAEKLLALLK